MYPLPKKKKKGDTGNLNITNLDLVDIYRTLCPTVREHTIFSNSSRVWNVAKQRSMNLKKTVLVYSLTIMELHKKSTVIRKISSF